MSFEFGPGGFHVSILTADLGKMTRFLECCGARIIEEGSRRIQVSWFGSQIFVHEVSGYRPERLESDEAKHIRLPHFGPIVTVDSVVAISQSLGSAGYQLVGPYERHAGTPSHHLVLFTDSPDGHCVEIKAFLSEP